jgi:site-specific recombinase XerD
MTTALARRQPTELGHPAEPVERLRRYIRASRSPRTLEEYAKQWRYFSDWCEACALEAEKASPETVAAYLTHLADGGRKVASISAALAAISFRLRQLGEKSPRESEVVRAAMAGIRRTLGTRQTRKAALTEDLLAQVLEQEPKTLTGLRNRALLLTGFKCALRRSELVALTVADVRFRPQGMLVLVEKSKTDQEGAGVELAVHYAKHPDACAVRALRAWLAAARITEGPLFRKVSVRQSVGTDALHDRTVARLIKKAAARAGLDEREFAGHSLRAGFATSAIRKGKGTRQVMKQTRHQSERVFSIYVREADPFADNATED